MITGPRFASLFFTTQYFGRPDRQTMLNFRVRDLDAMLPQLRAAAVTVEEGVVEERAGRFGYVTDPEGNRL